MLSLAFVTQSHIETGIFGMIGFPVVGAIYALVRKDSTHATEDEVRNLNERLARLEEDRRNYGS